MEVILKQDIKGLGYADDVVEVKPGYGRNYLIPKGYAIIGNDSNKRSHAENIKQAAHKAAKIKQDAQTMAEKISATTIDVTARIGESGKIFGSVTTTQIAAQLKAKGFEVDRKKITMEDSPKEAGTYPVVLDLHKEVKCEIKVNIVSEKA